MDRRFRLEKRFTFDVPCFVPFSAAQRLPRLTVVIDSKVPHSVPSAATMTVTVALLVALTACESVIAPPDEVVPGAIRANITYVTAWPPASEFVDIRFVAMRFIPQDTTDFLQLNRLEFSNRLDYGVSSQSVVLPEVPVGTYPFAVVARQRTSDILSWEALGIYGDDGGVFQVAAAETSYVSIVVDFENLPDFP